MQGATVRFAYIFREKGAAVSQDLRKAGRMTAPATQSPPAPPRATSAVKARDKRGHGAAVGAPPGKERDMAGEDDPWFTEPVSGAYKELAEKVRRVTGRVPSRTAARRGGISHDTITRMWQGERPTEATLVRFAIGYGISPNELLDAARFPRLTEKESERAGRFAPTEIQEIERILDPSDLPTVYRYGGLSDEHKAITRSLIEQFEAIERGESFGGTVAKD